MSAALTDANGMSRKQWVVLATWADEHPGSYGTLMIMCSNLTRMQLQAEKLVILFLFLGTVSSASRWTQVFDMFNHPLWLWLCLLYSLPPFAMVGIIGGVSSWIILGTLNITATKSHEPCGRTNRDTFLWLMGGRLTVDLMMCCHDKHMEDYPYRRRKELGLIINIFQLNGSISSELWV